jgi:hypothetical protein
MNGRDLNEWKRPECMEADGLHKKSSKRREAARPACPLILQKLADGNICVNEREEMLMTWK